MTFENFFANESEGAVAVFLTRNGDFNTAANVTVQTIDTGSAQGALITLTNFRCSIKSV